MTADEIKQQIKLLESARDEVKAWIHTADHGAYSQDKQKIAEYNNQIMTLQRMLNKENR